MLVVVTRCAVPGLLPSSSRSLRVTAHAGSPTISTTCGAEQRFMHCHAGSAQQGCRVLHQRRGSVATVVVSQAMFAGRCMGRAVGRFLGQSSPPCLSARAPPII